MAVSSIGSPAKPETEVLKVQKKVQVPTEINKSNDSTKLLKDSLILSEKAKDLAAKQSGTQYLEEQNESASVRSQESE